MDPPDTSLKESGHPPGCKEGRIDGSNATATACRATELTYFAPPVSESIGYCTQESCTADVSSSEEIAPLEQAQRLMQPALALSPPKPQPSSSQASCSHSSSSHTLQHSPATECFEGPSSRSTTGLSVSAAAEAPHSSGPALSSPFPYPPISPFLSRSQPPPKPPQCLQHLPPFLTSVLLALRKHLHPIFTKFKRSTRRRLRPWKEFAAEASRFGAPPISFYPPTPSSSASTVPKLFTSPASTVSAVLSPAAPSSPSFSCFVLSLQQCAEHVQRNWLYFRANYLVVASVVVLLWLLTSLSALCVVGGVVAVLVAVVVMADRRGGRLEIALGRARATGAAWDHDGMPDSYTASRRRRYVLINAPVRTAISWVLALGLLLLIIFAGKALISAVSLCVVLTIVHASFHRGKTCESVRADEKDVETENDGWNAKAEFRVAKERGSLATGRETTGKAEMPQTANGLYSIFGHKWMALDEDEEEEDWERDDEAAERKETTGGRRNANNNIV